MDELQKILLIEIKDERIISKKVLMLAPAECIKENKIQKAIKRWQNVPENSCILFTP